MPQTKLPVDAWRRLQTDRVAWLATLTHDEVPFPTPVWFVPDDDGTLLIFVKANSRKLANVRRHPSVTLHFDTDANGDDIVVITGTAIVDESVSILTHDAYQAKYAKGMAQISGNVDAFAATYSVGIRIVPLRAWVQRS